MAADKRTETNNLQGDIWTEDDDVLLAETVLRKVRQGKTVIEACREMEEMTNGKRTEKASKFRWFTKLVEQYKAGYELAKSEGEKVKASKKKRTNKGERYEQIMQSVLEKDDTNEVEKNLDIDDLIILAKKIKQQQASKTNDTSKLEKELDAEKKKRLKLERDLKAAAKEYDDLLEMYESKKRDYDKMFNALKVLKEAGLAITIPEPEKPKYTVGKDGVVTKVD